MAHLIELKDVYKIYPMGGEKVHALDGVSFSIDRGEFVAIVGQSGSGKSTAMNIIGCLDVPTSGTYHLGGVDVSTMDDDRPHTDDDTQHGEEGPHFAGPQRFEGQPEGLGYVHTSASSPVSSGWTTAPEPLASPS